MTVYSDFIEQQHEKLRQLLQHKTVRTILEEKDFPVLILEPASVAQEYRRMRQALPAVQFHYAMKANAHPAVIQAVQGEEGFFDAATNREIDLLQQLDVAPENVIHTHPYKKIRDIQKAYDYGVRIFVVDSSAEIEKFLQFPEAKLLIRLAYSNPYAHVDLSSKFGVSHAEARELMHEAAELNISVVGFSYHPGSHLNDVNTFLSTASQSVEFVQRLQSEGHAVEILDIGGGFPASYTQLSLSVEEIAATLNPILQPLVDTGVKILAEPGRALVGDAMTLISSVVGVAEGSQGKWYMLDDGLYGSYSNILTEHIHPYIVSQKQLEEPEAELYPATLGGPTCDSVDVIASNLPLPLLTVGDTILSPTMGAYTSVTASEFNGIPLTKIVVID